MPYIEIQQCLGGWGYGMSGPFEDETVLQCTIKGRYVKIKVKEDPRSLIVYEDGKEPTISQAALLDGTGKLTPCRVLAPISRRDADHLAWLKSLGEQPLIGGIWNSQIGDLLPKYFQRGIELSGAELPKTPFKDKVFGFILGMCRG